MIGQTLGHYEITGSLGKGGMGEVWRARDTRLGREVAIKTLPRELATDADRLARFEREAKLLATLNHAHIASIYGLDEHQGTRFLAMELIEGQSLEERLKEGPLPVEEALRLALQIAQALEAAHEKGVLHRDLKPANVMIARDVVKVLDFGLAKAFSGNPEEASPVHSPALSLAMTQQGMILGTAAYMSPEQASGQGTDQRADIWAFGVVLYEMLTGMPLFSGESVPHVLADVLRSEPDWKRLPKNLHPRVKLLLERCLVKKPRNRYHSMADVRIDLEHVLADPRGVDRRDDMHSAAASRPLVVRLASGAGLLAVGGLVAGLAVWALLPAPAVPPVVRFTYLIKELSGTRYPAVSDDGTKIAFVNGLPPTIYVLDTADFEPRPVPDSAGNAQASPCFSPDATWVAYPTSTGAMRKSPVAGGSGVTIADDLPALSVTCDWGDDGFVYFTTTTNGIMRVPDGGGTAESITTANIATNGEIIHINPRLLPGGRELLFAAVTELSASSAKSRVVVLDLETRQRTVIDGIDGIAEFVQTGPDPSRGHLIFGQNSTLFAAAVDLRRRLAGDATPIQENVASFSGITMPAVSRTGTLAFMTNSPDEAGIGSRLAIIERSGAQVMLPEPVRSYDHVAASPADGRAAIGIAALGSTTVADIWHYDLDDGGMVRLPLDGFNIGPIWSPDGRRLFYASAASVASLDTTLVSLEVDSSDSPQTLADVQGMVIYPTSISPDGTVLIGVRTNASNGNLWALPLDGPLNGSPAAAADFVDLLATDADELHATFSPDGRWIAYSSDETERDEIYVRPYPGPGRAIQVSTTGGRQPRWHPQGRELFFLDEAAMMAVDVDTTGNVFRHGTPARLFDVIVGDFPATVTSFAYDVMPDGERFLMMTVAGTVGAPAEVHVTLNWFSELLAQVPLSDLPP